MCRIVSIMRRRAPAFRCLCLHTAGSDGRQYRGLLNDSEITKRFRVVVFDLPWHGKSSPPENFQNQQYRLTPQSYIGAVLAVVEGLGLDRPVVMGCSIGARGVLYLLINHADKFRAGIALQASRSVGGTLGKYQRELEYLARSDVNGGEAAARAGQRQHGAAITGGRSNGKPCGTTCRAGRAFCMATDISTGTSATLRRLISPASTPNARRFMCSNGEYDYSATPAHGEEVARAVPGAKLQIMPDIGHFPPSENYPVLRRYLLPVLSEIK